MPYDAKQSTAQEMRGMNPDSEKFLWDGEAKFEKEIGYRARLVGGSRFVF